MKTQYTGKMTDVDDDGESMRFTLDGKDFTTSGEMISGEDVVRVKLIALRDEVITLIPEAPALIRPDHHFIERMEEVGPNTFRVSLGS